MRQLKDCVCGRPATAHRFDSTLRALMESRDGVCDGYEPSDGVVKELNFDEPTDEESNEEETQ